MSNPQLLANIESVILGKDEPSDELIAWLKKMEGAVYRQGGKMDRRNILWSIRYFAEHGEMP